MLIKFLCDLRMMQIYAEVRVFRDIDKWLCVRQRLESKRDPAYFVSEYINSQCPNIINISSG